MLEYNKIIIIHKYYFHKYLLIGKMKYFGKIGGPGMKNTNENNEKMASLHVFRPLIKTNICKL